LIGRGAIIHSDQGSQYMSVEHRRLLYIHGFRQSLSRRGNCYDNAMAESFFSRFKAELVGGGIFSHSRQAKSSAGKFRAEADKIFKDAQTKKNCDLSNADKNDFQRQAEN